MARTANKVKTRQITSSFAEPLAHVLDRLAEGGLMGKNAAEVVEQMVAREVLRMKEAGSIDIDLMPKQK
jgi:hypothetical protein